MGKKKSAMIKFSSSKQSHNTDQQDGEGTSNPGASRTHLHLEARAVGDEAQRPRGTIQRINIAPQEAS